MKLLFVLGVVIASASACSDTSIYCQYISTSQCNNAIMKTKCPSRCGTCGTNGGGGGDGSCSDASSHCPIFTGKCSNPIVKAKCKKMCNSCGGTSGGSGGGSSCVDSRPDICLYLKQKCNQQIVKTKCKKTCNACNSGGSGGSIPPTPSGGGGGLPKDFKCGVSKIAQSRVINGKDAKAGAWPWQIAMVTTKGQFFCGGSLVNAKWIVTASHCIDKQQASSIKIVLGALDFRKLQGTEQIRGIRRMIMHPSYGRLNNDIALIELDSPAMFTDTVQPVCLPAAGEAPSIGSKCYLTGWGKVKHPGGSHPILQQVALSVQEKSKCNSQNGKYVGITDQMLCAANPGTKQMGCHGDSGGPFVCQQSDSSWKLQGAVSWGSPTCDADDAWTVFARVAEFRGWIDGYINN